MVGKGSGTGDRQVDRRTLAVQSCGYASTSSKIKFRIGTDRNPAALLAPTISSRPPGKFFCVIVLLLSLLLAGARAASAPGNSRSAGRCAPWTIVRPFCRLVARTWWAPALCAWNSLQNCWRPRFRQSARLDKDNFTVRIVNAQAIHDVAQVRGTARSVLSRFCGADR